MVAYRIVAEGQSNCGGKGLGGPDWDKLSDRIKVWNNRASRADYPEAYVGNAWVKPVKGEPPFITSKAMDFNSLSVSFCAALANAYPSHDIRMIQHHRGGESIRAWTAGSYMRTHMQEVSAAAGGVPATIDLWHQGEADCDDMDPALWRSIMMDRITGYRAAGVLAANSLTIIGGIASWDAKRRAWNDATGKMLADTYPASVRFADPTGLRVVKPRNNHFTGSSLWTFGQRYYHAWKLATG